MSKLLVSALTCMLAMSGAAWADASAELAKSKQCNTCHSAGKDALAPSYKSIAAKYKTNEKAEAALVKTIRMGSPDQGGYHWGTMKMVPPGSRTVVSEAEAKQLTAWILGQK